MATIGGTVLTLSDFAQRLDPDGSVPDIAELLNEKNEVLSDMLWVEGNLPTGMRTTQRAGLPNPGQCFGWDCPENWIEGSSKYPRPNPAHRPPTHPSS